LFIRSWLLAKALSEQVTRRSISQKALDEGTDRAQSEARYIPLRWDGATDISVAAEHLHELQVHFTLLGLILCPGKWDIPPLTEGAIQSYEYYLERRRWGVTDPHLRRLKDGVCE
jgi:hypothetical protein